MEIPTESLSQASHRLDVPISKDEVLTAVKQLKKGKSAGSDGVSAEMLKEGGEDLIEALWRMCEQCFAREEVPSEWMKGIIVPILKSGNKLNPLNYRGITLLNVVSKVYASVLTTRLSSWAEAKGILVEEQAGFRPGRSVGENIYILTECIKSRIEKEEKVYTGFLDIEKAYDRVDRQAVWASLLQRGVSNKMLRVLQSLYKKVKSCVKVEEGLCSSWFDLEVGLRQGCPSSPILFILFIDGLARAVKEWANKDRKRGILEVSILLFADDIVLLAKDNKELQSLLAGIRV
jgi:hypothetical protein